MNSPGLPKLRDVKETALYVDDLTRARRFYCDVMGLRVLVEDAARFCALDVGGRHVLLLLFVRGTCNAETRLPGGIIPSHDGTGPLHVGFPVDASELEGNLGTSNAFLWKPGKPGEAWGWMNAHANIAAQRSARNHLEHYGTFTGDLRRPLVTMHGIFDLIGPVSHEAVYRALVDAAGNGDKLVQVYVNRWHSEFSAGQYLSTVAAMQYRLDTGVQPDASFFPESMGFDNSFVPPPWPY